MSAMAGVDPCREGKAGAGLFLVFIDMIKNRRGIGLSDTDVRTNLAQPPSGNCQIIVADMTGYRKPVSPSGPVKAHLNSPKAKDYGTESYFQSWRELVEVGMADLNQGDDPLTIRCILGALALAKGAIKLGALITTLDGSEINEILEERLEWSRLYS